MLGVRLTQIAAVYMVAGLGLGLAMGIAGDFLLTSVHAHISLLGWATMALCGTIYLVMPGCERSRLATLHFWGHNAGLPVMMAGLAFKAYGHESAETAVAAGSTLVLASLLLFAVNLLLNAKAPR